MVDWSKFMFWPNFLGVSVAIQKVGDRVKIRLTGLKFRPYGIHQFLLILGQAKLTLQAEVRPPSTQRCM